MTCCEVIDFLMAYLDHALPREQQVLFDRHLAGCPECRNFLNTYQETVKLGASVGSGQDSEAIPPEVVEAILRATRRASE